MILKILQEELVCKMAQLTAKSDNLSFIPGLYVVEGEN